MALRDRPERATAPPESHGTGPTAVALRLRLWRGRRRRGAVLVPQRHRVHRECAAWRAATELRAGSSDRRRWDSATRRPRTHATAAPPRSGTGYCDRVSTCSIGVAGAPVPTWAESARPPGAMRNRQRARRGCTLGAHAAAGPEPRGARRTRAG
jgi:hypothetical protein